MPNDLTQTYSRSVPRNPPSGKRPKGQKKQEGGAGGELLLNPSQDEQLSSMEQIR